MDETRRWWEETATYFQQEANVSVGLDWGPGVPTDDLGMLPEVDDLDVVELGCGGGQLGVGVAERGAGEVIGVDLSRSQLEFATELVVEHDVPMTVLEGDVQRLPLADDVADLAVSAYVLQWVPSLEATFAEAARILRPGGTLVCSLPHPFYGVFDTENGGFERSYHTPEAVRYDESGIDADQILHYRRVSDLLKALRDTGFTLDRFVEPGDPDPTVYDEQWSSQPELMARIPRTLIFRASLS
jgi:SAM-dependent methyltransferase